MRVLNVSLHSLERSCDKSAEFQAFLSFLHIHFLSVTSKNARPAARCQADELHDQKQCCVTRAHGATEGVMRSAKIFRVQVFTLQKHLRTCANNHPWQ